MGRRDVRTATIANGQTVSDAVLIGEAGWTVVGLYSPTLTGVAITFQGIAADGDTYRAVHGPDGNAISVTVASDRYTVLDPTKPIVGLRGLKVVSGSAEGAERAIKVVLYAP